MAVPQPRGLTNPTKQFPVGTSSERRAAFWLEMVRPGKDFNYRLGKPKPKTQTLKRLCPWETSSLGGWDQQSQKSGPARPTPTYAYSGCTFARDVGADARLSGERCWHRAMSASGLLLGRHIRPFSVVVWCVVCGVSNVNIMDFSLEPAMFRISREPEAKRP